jgi:hypothetical protein
MDVVACDGMWRCLRPAIESGEGDEDKSERTIRRHEERCYGMKERFLHNESDLVFHRSHQLFNFESVFGLGAIVWENGLHRAGMSRRCMSLRATLCSCDAVVRRRYLLLRLSYS